MAIDWAYAGIGPVGEEIAPLIVAAPVGGGAELAPWIVEAPVFNSYLQGLSEAGWHGEAWSVRFGFAASAALRYTFMTVAEMLSDVSDEGGYASIEQRRGQPIAQVIEQHGALTHFLLGLEPVMHLGHGGSVQSGYGRDPDGAEAVPERCE